MSLGQQEKKFPVRFTVDQQQQNILMNDILFTFDDDDDQDETSSIQNAQKLNKAFNVQQQQHIQIQNPVHHQVQIQGNPIIMTNTPPIFSKTNPNNIRRSSLKANSKFPAIQLDKEFILESKKKDSSSSSNGSCSEISESSNEDDDDDIEEDQENSQIMSLKKKKSKRVIDEEESIIGYDEQKFKEGVKEAVEQILKLIRGSAQGSSKTIYNYAYLFKSFKFIATQTQSFTVNSYSFQCIDLSSLIFFYSYLMWKDDQPNLKTLHEYCQKKIKDKQLEQASLYNPFENVTELRIDPIEIMKKILETESSNIFELKQFIGEQFLLVKQNIFEASLFFQYLQEFKRLSNFYQTSYAEKFEYYLKKGVFERSLELENESFVQIFLENNYYLTMDLTQENYEYIQACQYEDKHKSKPILNAFVMIYFYSIEHLCPKLMRYFGKNLRMKLNQLIVIYNRFILSQIEEISILKQIFHHLVLYHLNSLAKIVLLKILAKKQEYEKEIINLCLRSFNFDFLFQYYEVTGIKFKGWIEESENQRLMIKALGRSTGINFQSLVFFIRKIQLWSQKDLIHLMAETLYERLDASNNETNFLFTFSNPLKVIVLIIEILIITIKNEFFHKNMLEKARKRYSLFAQKLIKTAIDEEQMYDLLVDWDLEGRKLLYIIYENSMNDLIADDKVQDVIDILWYGNTNTSFNLLNFCSISQNLFNPALQKQSVEVNNKKIQYPYDKSYQGEDFIGRQSVWINQIQFRNLIDQSLVIIFMIAFLAYFLQSFKIFTEGFLPVRDDADIVETTIEKFQNNMSKWIIVNLFIGINLPLNAIVNLVYLREFERSASFNAGQILDLLFAIVTNIYTIFVYSLHLYNYQDIQVFMIALLNILCVFCYLRLILCLTATKAFGIILQALGVIFIEVAKFFKPFLAIILLFSFVGFILFNQLESGQFRSFVEGLLFLVEAMFGQFSFADFDAQYPITGVIFMLLHLYALAVIFMNVLVAILAFNFEKTNRQARILHYQHIIFHVRQGNYLEKHGCLIVIPIILEFVLIPYLIFKRFFHHNSPFIKKSQNFYINLSYSPILFIIILLTIGINLVLLPLAYLQRIFTLTKLYFFKAVKLQKLFYWLLLGLPFMIRRLFYEDMKELINYLLSKQSQEEQANQIQKKITFDSTVRQIFKTICKMYVSGITYCTISELFIQIKEDMQNPLVFPQESCVDDDQIVGVHLLKKNYNILYSMNFSSPNLERLKSQRRSSTPLQLHLLQKQNSKSSMQKIDQINVKNTFQGIPQMEEDCELFYEYFEKFCFKDIAREDEKRDSVLNLQNILKLHEHYDISELSVVIHYQLYKTIKFV